MTLMLALIFGCVVLGLWLPKRRQVRWLVAVAVIVLIAAFFIAPRRL